MERQEILERFQTCVSQNDFVGWNKFRRMNRKVKIDFTGAIINWSPITKFNLSAIVFTDVSLRNAQFENCNLNNAIFQNSECFGALFSKCAMVSNHFTEANLSMARFEDCDLRFSTFERAKIHQVTMSGCQGANSDFEAASFNDTSLEGSSFKFSNLSGCDLSKVELKNANFEASMVDGKTIIWDCYYNKNTNFTGVGLSSCRIEPVLMSSFQCNIRRIWWINWYRENINASKSYLEDKSLPFKKRFSGQLRYIGKLIITDIVKGFWWMTDYGSSTVRLLSVFLVSTLLFTSIYCMFPHLTNDIILNTSDNFTMVVVRALYFSIVINTGLGFGEINASDTSYAGHIIISMHSLLGFILLGAFLVRIGILFQGEFPVASERHKQLTHLEKDGEMTHEDDHH